MEVLLYLLVVLVGVSNGGEMSCDARQGPVQCYGSLGGPVALRLMTELNQNLHYKWKKNMSIILNIISESIIIINDDVKERSSFIPSNGTFMLRNILRTDSGVYHLESFDSETGEKIEQQQQLLLQLTIQAPVSSTNLSTECLSQGEMKVSCSSEGDSLHYSWTLGSSTVLDSMILTGNSHTNSITVEKGLSGQLTCLVQNNVSSATVSKNISPCEGLIFINCTLFNGTKIQRWVFKENNTMCMRPSTTAPITEREGKESNVEPFRPSTYIPPTYHSETLNHKHFLILAGCLSALIILTMVVTVVCCVKKKKTTAKSNDTEREQDVMYSDLNILQIPQREKMDPQVDVVYGQVKEPQKDVVYGQIKVSEGHVQAIVSDCSVYSRVNFNQ